MFVAFVLGASLSGKGSSVIRRFGRVGRAGGGLERLERPESWSALGLDFLSDTAWACLGGPRWTFRIRGDWWGGLLGLGLGSGLEWSERSFFRFLSTERSRGLVEMGRKWVGLTDR